MKEHIHAHERESTPMKLGVDFGTTRIVAARVDRGNYPIVKFDAAEGTADWFPPLVAIRGGERRYGWDAWTVQSEPGWTLVRSLKRLLENAGPATAVDVDGAQHPLMDLVTGMLLELKRALGHAGPVEVMLGVPANANSNQRFLTVDAFRRAGFEVLGLLNEPSAAAIELGHSTKLRGQVLVYDLGGGTFDASVVQLDRDAHTVVASEGIGTLGGDDFDRILAEIAVGEAALGALSGAGLFRLLEECRRQKEALHPNTRKIALDLDQVREGWGQVTVPVAAFYDRCRPLVDETIRVTAKLFEEQAMEALYVTGGGSELPLVARMLREHFGRRVRRSAYTRSATAIGLAIQADASSGYTLRDVFARNFGVWRERDGGRVMMFDVIFPRGTPLPGPGEPPLTVRRAYRPAHNIGHFRYLEATSVDAGGQPAGDIAVWDDILFPLDPALEQHAELDAIPVQPSDAASAQDIQEQYACNGAGSLAVTIHNLTSHHAREYPLGRWSSKAAPVAVPGRKRARR
jgi:molecular chaperone DnaK (HSP70)